MDGVLKDGGADRDACGPHDVSRCGVENDQGAFPGLVGLTGERPVVVNPVKECWRRIPTLTAEFAVDGVQVVPERVVSGRSGIKPSAFIGGNDGCLQSGPDSEGKKLVRGKEVSKPAQGDLARLGIEIAPWLVS